ncbi:MAG: hypothetical protein ABL899_01450 [Nitrospira sp.]
MDFRRLHLSGVLLFMLPEYAERHIVSGSQLLVLGPITGDFWKTKIFAEQMKLRNPNLSVVCFSASKDEDMSRYSEIGPVIDRSGEKKAPCENLVNFIDSFLKGPATS